MQYNNRINEEGIKFKGLPANFDSLQKNLIQYMGLPIFVSITKFPYLINFDFNSKK